MNKYILQFLLLLLCNSVGLIKAQDEYRAPLPSVVPMSPNAVAMAQYVDFPVSHYTGVPNINIPLYEADIYGYKLPINLSYHASGIKVSQEASWVGLGWNLNVGGSISRSIKGTDDLKAVTRNGYTVAGYYKGPEVAGNNTRPPYNTGDKNLFFETAWGGIFQLADSEPDIFYFSFPGGSGKFILDKSRGAVLFSKDNNIKINVIASGTYSGYFFSVVTPDGVQYVFNKEEKTRTYSANNTYLNKNYTTSNVEDKDLQSYYAEEDVVTSWHLTKIILPNKKEIVYTYADEFIKSPAQESLRLYMNPNGSTNPVTKPDCSYAMGTRYSLSKTETSGYRLSKIAWDGGYIDFIPGDRNDLNGTAKRLNNIKVYNKSNTLVKQFNFNYSYFNSSSYSYIHTRLKLTQVYENKSYSVGSIPAYKFSYNEGTIPAKNTKNTDYWGYHNNGKYGAMYCPKQYIGTVLTTGVNKPSNLTYLKIGTLNKITLPTGGNVIYDFEENTFSNGGFASDNPNKGAGLRVKQITTDGKIRKFTYSGGTLLAPPVLFCWDIVCPSGGAGRSPNCIVTMSEPKMPLSSFSNGNTVGYDQVEEYVTDGTNTSKVRYNFYNDEEYELYEEIAQDLPRITNYYNGLPKQITSYANNTIVEKIDYEYKSINSQRVEAFKWDPMIFSSYNYFYQAEYVQKVKENVQRSIANQGTISLNKQFTYNTNFFPSSSKLIIDATANESQEQITYYPTDFTDNISKAMVTAYQVGVPVETIGLVNGQVVFGKKTEFKQVGTMYLPNIVYTLDTNTPRTKDTYKSYYTPKLYFDVYNDYGKISQVRDNGISIVYIWGYNGMYPIAEIKNATYQDVSTAMGGTTVIKAIESRIAPTADDWTKINALRAHALIKNAFVSIYKYSPLVGTSEVNDLRKLSTFYEYDSYGRLYRTSFDNNGTRTLLEKIMYNYK
ncbi:hypothetical protein D0T84_21595 [Dysgonomonas sp. 521]|uniref:hypothetical protein n=1 Tax=Dysgonomonas sp. 521 TaxID=2302932 RepID=UPI0013D4B08F|nr:hypothetical protein [Dysgonomonas sp. 521]NDV97466.1 hypothetical protein [Dysgonomonas sp. 521]